MAATVATALLGALPAAAQDAAPAQPQITMPVLQQDEGVVYPPQAITDKVTDTVVVRLILELDAAGAVTKATVEAPVGHGFDEAAEEAARKLVFSPALRNGSAIAAKIRHTYTFAPPPARIRGRISTQLRDAPLAGATVAVTASDGTARVAITKDDGSYEVEGLAAGTYTITVTAQGYAPQTSTETLDPASEAAVVVRLARPELAPPPAPPGTEEVDEVTVRGNRPPREVTKRTLEQRELQRIPGTNGDALRAIQNLPGVARPPALAGLLIVRGASPQETGTYVDGTYVPIIYHFGGLSSVIPTEMLEKIDFYPGNFSTYFGRHTGGVVDVAVKDPDISKRPNASFGPGREGYHALVQADLIDIRGLVSGPIGHTGWNFSASGRRSWIDVWLKPALSALDADVSTAPVYYDYQLVAQKSWDHKKHNLRFMFFGSDDRLAVLVKQVNAQAPGATGNFGLGTAFYRFQARYVGKLSDDVELRAVAAVGKDSLNFGVGDNFLNVNQYPISGRLELSAKIASGVRNNFGTDLLYGPYDVNLRLPRPPRPGAPPAGPFGSQPPLEVKETGSQTRPAFYDELELTPFKGTRIVPGVRLDYTHENGSWDVQPRVNGRQDLTKEFPRTTIKGGIGRFANPPQPQETNSTFGVPGTRSILANHYGAGIEQEITRNLEVGTEGFYRQYDRVIVSGLGNVGAGKAYGLETLLRYKPDKRFFGFVAYTLSRSTRSNGPGEPDYLFQYDQTHIFTAVGSYRLGGGWELGVRYRLVSGSMTTPVSYGFLDANVGAYIAQTTYPPYSERNPLFHQLDIRIDKAWQLAEGVRLSTYLDLYNAYNQGNAEGVNYNYNDTLRTRATGIPILPSIGLRLDL